jgi:hypothetical protein
MGKTVVTEWFVEPCDSHTNEVIAKNLAALNQIDTHASLYDSDGFSHSVFQVEGHSFITRLYKDRHKFSLRFNVFSRQGRNGKLNPWKFEESKAKKEKRAKKLEIKKGK